MAFGLETLFGAELNAFVDGAWPDRSLVHHGPIERLRDLVDLEVMRDVATMVSRLSAGIFVMDPGAFTATGMGPAEAIAAYHAGSSLYLVELQTSIPALRPLRAAVARGLGLHPQHVSCEAFASIGAGSVQPHYDADLNVNIQLVGAKRWQVAPNRTVEAPSMGYDATAGPASMPDDTQAFETSPGSVVFLPRAWWHATEVPGRSLALVFTIRPPSLATLVTEVIKRRLDADPRWRAYPLGLAGPAPERIAERLAGLLAETGDFTGLDAAAVLETAPELGFLAYRWVGAPPVLRAAGDGRRELVHGGGTLRVHQRYAPLLDWLVDCSGSFTPGEAVSACAEMSADRVQAGLRFLLAKGLLEAI